MDFLEKKISYLVDKQFPAKYREDQPELVAFVRAYYEWMETQDQTVYHARRLLEHRDIDSTIDSFLKHFKSKYLNGIQSDTAVATNSFVKHSLDLYRSKGTERAIDLFFKNVFGVPAKVYFPAKDIFRTSSGVWIEPKYIEVQASSITTDFVGLQIEGVDSGARAFVEKYVRKRSTTGFDSHVLFITSLVGHFVTGEKIRSTKTGTIGPAIIGSLTSVTVRTSASGFEIGDLVSLESSGNGRGAMARVSEVTTESGKVSFELDNGGWGYNTGSEVIIAEKMLSVANVDNSAVSSNDSFLRFETIVQPLTNVHYTSLSGNAYAVGDNVSRRILDGANTVSIDGQIVSLTTISNTEGYALVSFQSDPYNTINMEDTFGLLAEDGFPLSYEDSIAESTTMYLNNTASSTISSATDLTATANVMKYSANVTIDLTSAANLVLGDELFQVVDGNETANGFVVAVSKNGSNATVRLGNAHGSIINGPITRRSDSSNSTVVNKIVTVGIFDVVNDFVESQYAPVYGLTSNTYGMLSSVSSGLDASISVSNTYDYVETVAINTDVVGDYLQLQLNASDYGFPASGVETLTTSLSNALSYSVEDYGRITRIEVTNSGRDYNSPVYVVVFEKNIYNLGLQDFAIELSTDVGEFLVGESILQSNTVKGVVRSDSSGTTMYIERTTTSSMDTSQITGSVSGATANVVYVGVDTLSEYIGINALILSNTATATGSVSNMEIIDSGFAYADGEELTYSMDESLEVGIAVAHVEQEGIARGYHRENNSVLSGDKYLQDGRYYQEFSYEVRSAITLDKYADMLKSILHVAGTELFAKYVFEDSLDVETTATSTLTIS